MVNNMIGKTRVCFILDHKLMNYRIPFFSMLKDKGYDLSIIHPGEKVFFDDEIKQIHTEDQKFFPFIYRSYPNLGNYDIVVHMQNIRILNLWFMSWNPFKKYKLVHWGIGASSAKGLHKNKKKNFISTIRNLLARGAAAQVLYSEFTKPLFSNKVQSKTFIAHNTIFNPLSQDHSSKKKDSFLFIGSLNERKGLEILIRAFKNYLHLSGDKIINKFFIIGDGPLMGKLKEIVENNNLTEHVCLLGNIDESEIKSNYFKRAIVSISLLQAGLSVLESFSFGVPFIAYKDAISGGEHYNIKNKFNGYLVDSEKELMTIMQHLNDNPKEGKQLGKNAFDFYTEQRQMKFMVDSFNDTFQYVLK